MSARERLDTVVRDLTRARRLQVLTDCGWAGLFWGLVLASAAVLIIRVGQWPFSAMLVGASSLALALTVAAIVAWQRRPDDLHVAILADLRLDLSQKLSTAWEFSRLEADGALAERLADQAVRARLPSRHERVFPWRISTWGRLTPIAAGSLMLVSIVDLHRAIEPAVAVLDEIVVGEGVRLREFGRRMEARARREELPRSTRESQEIQRLGTRMENATLSRGQVLSRLRQLGETLGEQRRNALTEGVAIDAGPLVFADLTLSQARAGWSPRAMLRRLVDGRLAPDDAASLGLDAAALSRLGITPEDLEAALAGFAAGDDRELRRILETLSRADQASSDARELRRAEEEVRRVRENLGETGVAPAPPDDLSPGVRTAADGGVEGLAGHASAEGIPGEDPGSFSDSQAGQSPRGTSRRDAATFRSAAEGGTFVKPPSQMRDGPVLTSEARVLPRSAQPTVEAIELDARYAAQMEEVLAKEDYPVHFKEFIRRYFLSLSEGVPGREVPGE